MMDEKDIEKIYMKQYNKIRIKMEKLLNKFYKKDFESCIVLYGILDCVADELDEEEITNLIEEIKNKI